MSSLLQESSEKSLTKRSFGAKSAKKPLCPISARIIVKPQNEVVTAPMVVEVTINDVASGSAVQLTRGLKKGESKTLMIAAP